jgi:MFS family permease
VLAVRRSPSTESLGLLRQARGFRLLFLATLASSVGTWLAYVALVVDVFDRTRDATWVSALLIAEFVPTIVLGVLAGRLIDRASRRSILIGADVGRVAVFCLLPFAGGAAQIVLLAFAAGIATSLFRPAAYAGLPNLVSDRQLPRANGLLQGADNLTWAIGSLAGGALIAVAGPDPAYFVNAVSFAASALLIARIGDRLEEDERPPTEGRRADLRAGFALAVSSRALVTVLVAWSIVMLAMACVNVSEVVLAKEVFDAGDFGYGLLVSATGVGLVIGSLVAGGWLEQRGVRVPYAVSIALMALVFGIAAAAPNVWIAAVAVMLAGVGNGVAVVANAVLVQRGAPDHLRGRAFTVVMSAGYAVLGLGMVAAGFLTDLLGARTVWGLAAGLLAAGAGAGWLLLRGVTFAPADEGKADALLAEPVHETSLT